MYSEAARGPPRRNAITGISGGCARAASGHAAVDPATPAMNSRRRIAFPKVQDHTNRAVQLREQSRKLQLTEWGADSHFAAQELCLSDVAQGPFTTFACFGDVRSASDCVAKLF